MLAGENGGVKGIILAGVHQWEGSSFERALPRPLVPVANLPVICYPLRWLRDGGIKAQTICANSASHLVRSYLGDGSRLGAVLEYYEDWTPRGPAGCLRDAISHDESEVIVVVDGATVPRIDLTRLLDAHVGSGALVTVVVAPGQRNGGALRERLTPTGIYVFQRRAFDDVERTGYRDIKEVLIPRLHQRGEQVLPHLADGPCLRVLGPATYLHANEWMLKRLIERESPLPGYRRAGKRLVHHSACVAPAANLVGPVLIGPETKIAENAMIVGPTVIGAGCRVAEEAAVCRSVIWDRCDIGENAIVDRAILADEAAVPAGTRLSYAVRAPARTAVRSVLRDLRSRVKLAGRRIAGSPRVAEQVRVHPRS